MVRVILVSQTMFGLGSQVNSRFHRAVGKTSCGATQPLQASRPFAKTKQTSPGNPTFNPRAVRPSAEFVGVPYDRRDSLRSQTAREPASGVFHPANWLADIRL
jgi:hypothetical protein